MYVQRILPTNIVRFILMSCMSCFDGRKEWASIEDKLRGMCEEESVGPTTRPLKAWSTYFAYCSGDQI